jgi:hypothetical protein
VEYVEIFLRKCSSATLPDTDNTILLNNSSFVYKDFSSLNKIALFFVLVFGKIET